MFVFNVTFIRFSCVEKEQKKKEKICQYSGLCCRVLIHVYTVYTHTIYQSVLKKFSRQFEVQI